MYYEKIVDTVNNQEIIREFTKEEIKQMQENAVLDKARHEELLKKQLARQSALNKLIDLGLTEEEIAAL